MFTAGTLSRLASRSLLRPVRFHLPISARFFASLPEYIQVGLPALSPTMEKGSIASWSKKVGDKIEANQTIAQVETDKATVAFDSVESGYLAKILVEPGKEVTVGTPVAIIVENEADIAAFKDWKPEGGADAKPAEKEKPKEKPKEEKPKEEKPKEEKPKEKEEKEAEPSKPQKERGGRVLASPAARRVANEKGVDIGDVSGTGGSVGRVVVADVLEYKPKAGEKAKEKAVAAEGDYVDIPHSKIKRVTAQRLTQSKQTIPHYYLAMECRVDKLLAVREKFNAKREKDQRLSINDFIVKAAALALKQVPEVNSQWQDDCIRQFNYVDISVAVMTPSGLLTPIVFDADVKGLDSIAATVKELGARAKAGKLQPNEFNGGTFTISNLGMYGITSFSAIINPPQAAILAVGTTTQRLVPGEKGASNPYEQANFVTVQLSCDHRVIDGAVGARWLQVFKGLLEDPVTMLL